MIGVRIPLVVVVAQHDMRTFPAHDLDHAAEHLVEVLIAQRLRPGVVIRTGHAGIAKPEELDGRVSDDRRRIRELRGTHLSEIRLVHDAVKGGIQDVACLAARRRHENRVDALIHIPGDRCCALGGFIVGMRVKGEKSAFHPREYAVPRVGCRRSVEQRERRTAFLAVVEEWTPPAIGACDPLQIAPGRSGCPDRCDHRSDLLFDHSHGFR